jgi:hypothetical protein
MQIDLSDAVKIYAKMCRARFGRRAAKVAKEQKARLQAKGDDFGAKVWDRLGSEILTERHHESDGYRASAS